MTSLPEVLQSIARQLADERAGEHPAAEAALLAPDEQIDVLRSIGKLQRLLDGIVVDVVDDIESEDARRARANRVTARTGCRNTSELLQRVMLIDAPAARRYADAADAVHETSRSCRASGCPETSRLYPPRFVQARFRWPGSWRA
ncbi:hypothetical protein [Microbacterium sp.]|uniref:hypothetical protein n=1 Tax=Microbacterium sp. TaxID=51671 RepID=UPI003A90C6B0